MCILRALYIMIYKYLLYMARQINSPCILLLTLTIIVRNTVIPNYYDNIYTVTYPGGGSMGFGTPFLPKSFKTFFLCIYTIYLLTTLHFLI